jgi:beta-galactosidase
MTRSLKKNNYLVLETQAQAFPNWTPYPGQLRLQAFSHLASGANMVAYWHWHSIHNSFETYWKGLLSHDFAANPVYNEAKTIGKDFARLSTQLVNLKKTNKAAILVSNESLTAMEWFKLPGAKKNYNDVVRLMYDELYKMNVGCDMINPASDSLEDYSLLIVPALYSAPDILLERLNTFVENGGHIVYSFKSGFTNEHVKVRTTSQPGLIDEVCGITYNMFVEPKNVSLKDDPFQVGDAQNLVDTWMELITPTTAKVLAYYDHPHWGDYAAITENNYGKGRATYIGCLVSSSIMNRVLGNAVKEAGLWGVDQALAFPLIIKSGTNAAGKMIRYCFNYSNQPISFNFPYSEGYELLTDQKVASDEVIELNAWGFKIFEADVI